MSFNIHNIFKSAMVLVVSAFASASCVQVEGDMTEAVGYLCAPSFDVDATVEDLMQTRALEGFTIPDPDLSAFHYVVKDKDGVTKYDAEGLWESLAMPVGKYSVEAELGTNGFGAPYFYGVTDDDAKISALEQEVPEMTVQVKNALLKVRVDSDFAQHFTLNSVVLTSGSESRTFTAAEISDWYFVPSGAQLSIRLVGESNAGVYKEFTHTITPAAKSANDIICRQDSNNMPSINLPDQSAGAWATRLYITPATFANVSADNQAKVVYEIYSGSAWVEADVISDAAGQATGYRYFKGLANGTSYKVRARIGNLISDEVNVTVSESLSGISVSSAHYNDASGNLAGTNATLSVSLPDGILKTLNGAGLLQITGYSLSNDKGVVRTAAAAGTMAPASGWPYLPQGSGYTLTVSHKLAGEAAAVASTNAASTVAAVPAPLFSINLTSYSSYDKYLENNKDAANSMDAFTIKTLGAIWTISPELMGNSNYSKSFTYNNNGQSVSSFTGNTCSLGDKGSLAVGTQYKVSASVTFDGKKVETGVKTHYITGIPYRQEPLVKDDWTSEKNHSGVVDWEYEANNVNIRPNPGIVRNGYARVTSNQEFFLPTSVNVNVVNDGKKIAGITNFQLKYFLRFGSTALIDGSEYKKNAPINYNASTVINAGTYKVQMEATYGAMNTTNSFSISKLHVLYGSLPQ